jgi:hypothetical protein
MSGFPILITDRVNMNSFLSMLAEAAPSAFLMSLTSAGHLQTCTALPTTCAARYRCNFTWRSLFTPQDEVDMAILRTGWHSALTQLLLWWDSH